MNSYVVVLNGASSAGKSTIARAIQVLAGSPVLHVQLDTFTDMFPWPLIADAADRQECHAAAIAHFHAALPILTSSRFPVVIDHVFEQPAWFEACAGALKGKVSYLVGVHCPLAILEERERARGDRKLGIARSQIERVHRDRHYALELDTSLLTPQECAAAILRLAEAP